MESGQHCNPHTWCWDKDPGPYVPKKDSAKRRRLGTAASWPWLWCQARPFLAFYTFLARLFKDSFTLWIISSLHHLSSHQPFSSRIFKRYMTIRMNKKWSGFAFTKEAFWSLWYEIHDKEDGWRNDNVCILLFLLCFLINPSARVVSLFHFVQWV